MSCDHGGMIFNRLYFRHFVRCMICGRWRLRDRGEIFWKSGPPLIGYKGRVYRDATKWERILGKPSLVEVTRQRKDGSWW